MKLGRREEVSVRYLKVDEIVSLKTIEPAHRIYQSDKTIAKMPELFIDCGKRHRV